VAHSSSIEYLASFENAVFDIASGGNYSKLSIPRSDGAIVKKGVTGMLRSTIKGFTRQSQARLRAAVNKIDQRKCPPPDFITLTYPQAFKSARASKKHLDRFLTAVRRAFPAATGIWKLEPQKRGAPHFHLLIFGACLPLEWVVDAWHTIAGRGDLNHRLWHLGLLGNGNKPCVEPCTSWDRVNAYVSKYCMKLCDASAWHEPGKFWGYLNRKCFDALIQMVTYKLTPTAAKVVNRTIRRWHRSKLRGRALVCYASHRADGSIEMVTASVDGIVRRQERARQTGDDKFSHPLGPWLTDIHTPAGRKWFREVMHSMFGKVRLGRSPPSLVPRLIWMGQRSKVRGGRSPRTMLVPSREAEKVVVWSMGFMPSPQGRGPGRAAGCRPDDAKLVKLVGWICDRPEFANYGRGYSAAR
jgi:hypothetical protein